MRRRSIANKVARLLREEVEVERLKRLVAELLLDKQMLHCSVVEKKW